ncbi:MAG: thiamine pyrophosphate-binding protein [Dehalococcoidia bacterium]|nr:thiamine pyrophosphate-binding protein [Dehalococcoidia bacterium]
MARMTGKRAFMEMLRAEGVRYIFGNPGTSESAIMASLPAYPDIEYLLATQEGVAMGMADGYACATGRPSFVNLHIETGLANGISLLHHAMDGGTPLVLTSGNKDIRKLTEGRTDLVEMVRQFTKWSVEITHAEQVPGALRRAFNEAKTPPTGPVFVGIAANALEDEADVEILPSPRGYFRTSADPDAVQAAAGLLTKAVNPIMVVGDRLAQSAGTDQAVRLAELLGARVYTTSYARMNFPSGHPQFLGRISPALPASREVLASGDVVLAVGTDVFSGFFYFSGGSLASGAKLIHVDSAYRAVGRSEPTAVGIIADPCSALRDIAAAVDGGMSGPGRETARSRALSVGQMKAELTAAWGRRLKEKWDQRPMSAERMMAEAAGALPPETIIVDDSISSKDALHGAFTFNGPDSIFGERVGAIGWGMGSAMGVKLAHPDRPVVGIVGDGSAMMTVQALWTAANANIPVVYLICNNRSYRILKLNMDVYQSQVLGEDLSRSYVGMDFPIPLNIAGIANAIGLYGRTIEDPSEIGPALRQAMDLGKPAVLDIIIDGSS